MQHHTDMIAWTTFGEPVVGTGGEKLMTFWSLGVVYFYLQTGQEI